MKKRFLSIFTGFLVLCLSACASSNQDTSNTVEPSTSQSEKLKAFDKSATMEETVIVDEQGIKITALNLQYLNYAVELNVLIENNTEKDLSFVAGSIGYCCNSINGMMINEGYMNTDVTSGNKANASLSFSYEGLMIYGIDGIANMSIGFEAIDEDYNSIYLNSKLIETSLNKKFDFEKDYYVDSINNKAIMAHYGFEIDAFSKDCLYKENGIEMVSSALITKDTYEKILLLEFKNNSSQDVYISTSDICVNGLKVFSGLWSNTIVQASKTCVVRVSVTDMLDVDFLDVYGIEDIGSLSLNISQKDLQGNSLVDGVLVDVRNEDNKVEFKNSDSILFDHDGIQIGFMDVKETSDVSVLLLVENKSGKTVTIDDEYGSLSVNGMMIDYLMYSQELEDGQCGVIEVELWDSSLEENQIDSIQDISFSLNVEVGYKTVDQAYIEIKQ